MAKMTLEMNAEQKRAEEQFHWKPKNLREAIWGKDRKKGLMPKQGDRITATLSHFSRFMMSLERVDRALAKRNVAVNSVGHDSYNPTLAWTDGQKIWVNIDRLADELFDKDLDDEDLFIAVLRALNYHELAHVMFTPRASDNKFSISKHLDYKVTEMLMNLEEGRIETLFVVGKAAVAKILEISYSTVCHDENLDPMPIAAYVLCYGREYLTDHGLYLPDIPESDRIHELCQEYNRLQFPAQHLRAEAIAKELTEMAPERQAIKEGYENNQANNDVIQVGRPVPERAKPDPDEAQKIADNNRQDVIEKAGGETPPSKKQPDPSKASSKTFGEKKADKKKAVKAQKDLVDKLMADPDVKKLLDDGKKDMNNHQVGGEAALQRVPVKTETTYQATPALIQEKNNIVRAIRRMVSDTEQERVRRQSEGRIDIARLGMSETDVDVFRQLKSGMEDEIPVDVFFALDCSSSMHGTRMKVASEAAWLMHWAANAIPGSKYSCLGFNSDYSTLIDMKLRPTDQVSLLRAQGGTNILGLLQDVAAPYLTQSRIANRYLVVASDGQWANPDKVKAEIKKLNAAGVTTLHFMISRYDTADEAFGYGKQIEDPHDISKVSIKMFTETLRKFAQQQIG